MSVIYRDFAGVEEVWFWFCSSVTAKQLGTLRSQSNYVSIPRVCEISDIYKILQKMKYDGTITNQHLRIMVKWGTKFESPLGSKRAKRSEIAIWTQGLQNLEKYLIEKGILNEF